MTGRDARHRRLVVAAGVFDDVGVEQRHLEGREVEVTLAHLDGPSAIAVATAEADGVIVATNPLDREAVAALGPRVGVIGRAGIGLDTIDLDAARERGIGVVYTPDYCTEEVANHTLAMILASQRGLLAGDRIARADWSTWRTLGELRTVSELTVGVVGLGRIGARVAELLLTLGATVVGYDPFMSARPSGVGPADSLGELLRESHVVALHVPLSGETRGLIGRRELELMKPGAVLVNVSRGGLVDETALVDALESGRLGGACLDVLSEEPPPPDAGILRAPNVLLSPHIAWWSAAAESRARTSAVDAMLAYLERRPLERGAVALDAR